MVICTSLFFLFSPPIANVGGLFDWSPGFTGHGSLFRFLFSLLLLSKVGSGLKRSNLTLYPLFSHSPKANRLQHPLRRVSLQSRSIVSTWVAECQWNRSQALHTRTSLRSRQMSYPPINQRRQLFRCLLHGRGRCLCRAKKMGGGEDMPCRSMFIAVVCTTPYIAKPNIKLDRADLPRTNNHMV